MNAIETNRERRRWRPTPRASTLSLSELLDACVPVVAPPEKPQKLQQRANERNKSRSRRGRNRTTAATGVESADARGASDGDASVIVENMVAVEEIQDPDERLDVEEELRGVLGRHGTLLSIAMDTSTGAITAVYASPESARVAVSELHGWVYGSRCVSAWMQSLDSGDLPGSGRQKPQGEAAGAPRKKGKRRSKLKSNVIRDRMRQKQQHDGQQDEESLDSSIMHSSSLVIRNLLDPEELEDDDEYEDIVRETRSDLSKHGQLNSLRISRGDTTQAADTDIGSIFVCYDQPLAAVKAFEFYSGNVFGGRQVTCAWSGVHFAVRVTGILAPEELEDSDEYEDVKAEVSEYFASYPQVSGVDIARGSGDCTVEFDSEATASEFVRCVRGKKYGGRQLRAQLVQATPSENKVQARSIAPTSRAIESTAEAPETQIVPVEASPEVTELAIALLKRLAALQERAHVQNPLQDKRSRRLVLGLHEVRRGILQRKIKLLVVGTDLEEVTTIGGSVHELVVDAQEQEIPVIWPMNRRKLGRVLKKSVRVSCVGIYSVDGANEVFKQLLDSI